MFVQVSALFMVLIFYYYVSPLSKSVITTKNIELLATQKNKQKQVKFIASVHQLATAHGLMSITPSSELIPS